MKYLRRLVGGFISLLVGLGVTIRHLFRRPVTLQYPREKPELSAAYRSAIALVRFPETKTHDCVACMQCVEICPSFCIHIEGEKPEGLKRKRATTFTVDYSLCSTCGLCIDVCPTTTLTWSKRYDEAGYRRDAFIYDLLTEYRDQEAAYLEQARREAEKAAAEKAAKAKPAVEPKAAVEAAPASLDGKA
ncbi:MAG: NADH-quinone oxidoreductase subunit I [Deltaproteobacteria bacterium]|nr:NADH-quinone oxidoreductase subunit I [Deltaproteobacteria bacterium]